MYCLNCRQLHSKLENKLLVRHHRLRVEFLENSSEGKLLFVMKMQRKCLTRKLSKV